MADCQIKRITPIVFYSEKQLSYYMYRESYNETNALAPTSSRIVIDELLCNKFKSK